MLAPRERTRAGPVSAPSFDDVATVMGLSEMQKGLIADARRARRIRRESHGSDNPARSLSQEILDRCDRAMPLWSPTRNGPSSWTA